MNTVIKPFGLYFYGLSRVKNKTRIGGALGDQPTLIKDGINPPFSHFGFTNR